MHHKFTVLMSVTLDGEATVEEQQLLQEHLRICALCAATWDLWRRLDRLLASTSPVVPALDYGDKVLRRLHRPPPPPDT